MRWSRVSCLSCRLGHIVSCAIFPVPVVSCSPAPQPISWNYFSAECALCMFTLSCYMCLPPHTVESTLEEPFWFYFFFLLERERERERESTCASCECVRARTCVYRVCVCVCVCVSVLLNEIEGCADLAIVDKRRLTERKRERQGGGGGGGNWAGLARVSANGATNDFD